MRKMVFLLLPAFLVISAGIIIHSYQGLPGFKYSENSKPKSEKVKLGGDYYIMVKLVELAPKPVDSDSWDSDGSAPDITVEIIWRGNQVYKSSQKPNTLIGQWSTAELDLRHIALTGKKTSVEDVIKAARISVTDREHLTIRVYDNDLLGSSELAGEFRLLTTDLILGESSFRPEAESLGIGALKRLVLNVVSMKEKPDIMK